jgi:hypothetical protein
MAKPIKPPPWNEGVPGTARAPSAGTGGGGRVRGPDDPRPGPTYVTPPLPASLRPENRHQRVYGRGAQPATPITPWRLAATGTEHGEQAALFCWAAMAARWGFEAADAPACYGLVIGQGDYSIEDLFISGRRIKLAPVPVLSRLLAIPNGGQRDKITAANLKAEGVKAGVPDVCLPFPLWRPVGGMLRIKYAGLFIELKRLKYKTHQNGGMTDEQVEWGGYLDNVGYRFICCHGWRAAADAIKAYINGS